MSHADHLEDTRAATLLAQHCGLRAGRQRGGLRKAACPQALRLPAAPAEILSAPSYHLQPHAPSLVYLLLERLVSRTCWQEHTASCAKQPSGRALFPRGGWKISHVEHRERYVETTHPSLERVPSMFQQDPTMLAADNTFLLSP